MKKKIVMTISILAAAAVAICISGIVYFATDLFASNPAAGTSAHVPILQKNFSGPMQVQFIRHATLLLFADGKKIIIDPMLEDAGTESPYPLTAYRVRNPLLPLPADVRDINRDLDAVLLTHYHPDHFDRVAETVLPRDILILCQSGDETRLKDKGFTNVHPLTEDFTLGKISITPYKGNHAQGILRSVIGTSASYNIRYDGHSLLVTGDTLLDDLLRASLADAHPDSVIAFAGSASFIIGAPITLGAVELKQIAELLPQTKIIAVHMNALNHCLLTREKLAAYCARNSLTDRITIPVEGATLKLK